MIVSTRRLGQGVFVFSRPLPGKLTVTQSCKRHQKQTHATLALTQRDYETKSECTCHLNTHLYIYTSSTIGIRIYIYICKYTY